MELSSHRQEIMFHIRLRGVSIEEQRCRWVSSGYMGLKIGNDLPWAWCPQPIWKWIFKDERYAC